MNVCQILYLRHGVELNHGSGKRLSVGTQRWDETQHGAVEGSIDLSERGWARIVDVHHRNVTQEPGNSRQQLSHCLEWTYNISHRFVCVFSLFTVPVCERFSARISGRITGTHELDPLQFDPSLV